MEQLVFLHEFFRHWKEVGSVAPSSRFLAERLCRQIDFVRAKNLVEFGPGMGNITRELLSRMRDDARLTVFEINENFCKRLTAIADPRLTVRNRSALLCDEGERGCADCIVSGIPLLTLSPEERDAALRGARLLLRAGGVYLHYQFTPVSYAAIKREFGNVAVDFVVANAPPAFVYKAIGAENRGIL